MLFYTLSFLKLAVFFSNKKKQKYVIKFYALGEIIKKAISNMSNKVQFILTSRKK